MSIFENKNNHNFTTFITSKVDKEINEYIDKNKVIPITIRVKEYCINLIKEYLLENILFIICVFGIILFLLYRYYMKKRKEKMENYRNSDANDSYDINEFQNKPFVRPTMNPYYPIKKQQNYSLYPPNKMPFKLDGKNIDFIRDSNELDQKVINGRDLREDGVPAQVYKYTYPNYGSHQSVGNCYSGLVNPYQHSTEVTFRSPLNYPTNFNETTGQFITSNVDRNQHIMKTYNNIIDSKNEILKKNLS